ncbi:hypothetical protein GF380_05235 [Candidatus Uhrbacteria bacterium]|nr:hypothetical protein [Candidatus Uhrbacteria bacterium]MBD3284435.1 hypothetical protein [Candidatus Uhrbacteria bacterium]
MPSMVVDRANLLAQAGVPVAHIRRVLDGHYDLWDEQTVYWDDQCPGLGRALMEFLRPVYEPAIPRRRNPEFELILAQTRAGFAPPYISPTNRTYSIELVSAKRVHEELISRYEWLDERIRPMDTNVPVPPTFPFGPVKQRLKDAELDEFGQFRERLPEIVRLRLWKSYIQCLIHLWRIARGSKAMNVRNPQMLRDLWLHQNCLPVGFTRGQPNVLTFIAFY